MFIPEKLMKVTSKGSYKKLKQRYLKKVNRFDHSSKSMKKPHIFSTYTLAYL
jgi:hypothetical protein